VTGAQRATLECSGHSPTWWVAESFWCGACQQMYSALTSAMHEARTGHILEHVRLEVAA
jgi:hypothetical protein